MKLSLRLSKLSKSHRPRRAGRAVRYDTISGVLTAPGRLPKMALLERPPSSSGLGHSPLTAKTGVRVPLGVIRSRGRIRSYDEGLHGIGSVTGKVTAANPGRRGGQLPHLVRFLVGDERGTATRTRCGNRLMRYGSSYLCSSVFICGCAFFLLTKRP